MPCHAHLNYNKIQLSAAVKYLLQKKVYLRNWAFRQYMWNWENYVAMSRFRWVGLIIIVFGIKIALKRANIIHCFLENLLLYPGHFAICVLFKNCFLTATGKHGSSVTCGKIKAALAVLSANSLPIIPMCDGIQIAIISILSFSNLSIWSYIFP